jgi:hypothetical protein
MVKIYAWQLSYDFRSVFHYQIIELSHYLINPRFPRNFFYLHLMPGITGQHK